MHFVEQLRNKELKCNPTSFEKKFISRREFIESMQHTYTLEGHAGCVNTMCWNESGTLLASGSDDQTIIIWSESGRKLQQINTVHTNNIFSVTFLSNSHDKFVVSAAGDRTVLLHDLEHLCGADAPHVQKWECANRVKRLAATPAYPRFFWSASEDGILRQYDVRCSKSNILLDFSEHSQLKSLAVNDQRPEMIALAFNDPVVPIYDRRNLGKPMLSLLPGHLSFSYEERYSKPMSFDRNDIVTHVAFSHSGDEIIANVGSENIYVYNVCETSSGPDIFSTLENFLNSDDSASTSSEMWPSFNISLGPKLFKDILDEAEKYIEKSEFSKAVDLYSIALDAYLRNVGLSHVDFLKHCATDLNAAIEGRVVKKQVAADLLKLLCQRGAAYIQRAWEGDAMAALRDFLWCVYLRPRHARDAHFRLVETLDHCFGQHDLAKRCFEVYKLHYGMDEYAKQFSAMLEMRRKREVDIAQSGASLKRRSSNAPWTREKYLRFRDYTDRFLGHCNMRTDIKEANWFGGHDEMIVAGSDYGYMFLWERSTQKILRLFKADEYSVNCVQCHPHRFLIASSGIDQVIRFWEPARTALNPLPKEERLSNVVEDRDKTSEIYEIASLNQSAMHESPLGLLMSSVGLPPALFASTNLEELFDSAIHEDSAEETNNDDSRELDGVPIRCRQM